MKNNQLSPATPAMRTDPLTPLLGLTMAEGISDVLFGSCRGSKGSREPAISKTPTCESCDKPLDDCECAEVEDIGDALARVSRQAFNALASEYANSTCEVDADYDVWDRRGHCHWWSDETKRSFVAWVDSRTA